MVRNWSVLTLLIAGLVGCHAAPPRPIGPAMNLFSASFADGSIPSRFSSCSGQSNIAPALTWSPAPIGTKSLAVIVYDRDSPFGANFVHWVLYDLPPTTSSLAEGTPKRANLPDGSRQGRNGFGDIGYGGPCPPGQAAHHYVFDLYALDTTVELPSASTESQLVKVLRGHVIAGGEFIGVFQR